MMNERQIEAELRLFKGYTISEDEFYDGKLRENAYGNGILFLEEPSPTVLEKALELYGKDGEKWNQTFHKSFSIVILSALKYFLDCPGYSTLEA